MDANKLRFEGSILMSDDPKTPESSSMLSRFSGAAGKELLLDVLADTSLLRGVADLGDFVGECEVCDIPLGSEIIQQGASDNSLYIIVSGSFDVMVNGRRLTTR